MAYVPNSGSVVAFQSDPTKLVGTVSIVGTIPFSNSSVIAVLKDSSVAALQGTNPWMVQLTSGSIATTVATGNSSVQVVGLMPPQSVSGVGTFNINPVGNGSVIGVLINSSVAALQGTNPWFVQLTSGSVITTGGNSSVLVVGVMPPQSVSGVGTFNIDPQGAGSIIAKLINSSVTAYQGVTPWVANGSVAVMSANPFSVATLQGTNPWVISNSSVAIMSANAFSVAALQSTSPWLITGSVASFPLTGASVIAVLQAASIAGTYQEDAGHTSADRGLFVLGVRNDTVASFVSADLDYSPLGVDSAGRTLVQMFAANEASVYGHASTVNGGDSGSVVGVVAAGTGLRNYITDITIANTGSVSTLINFTEGGGSILGRTIAPAGGGSNMIGLASPIRNQTANQPIYVVSGTASSILYATLRGYRAP